MSFPFPTISELPPDPIFGVDQAFRADKRERKLNLSVGYYYDSTGKIPTLRSIKSAASECSLETVQSYLPIDGHPAFIEAMMKLVLGESLAKAARDRIVAIQTPGGTGALRLGMEFAARVLGSKQLWLPNPTWENHVTLGRASGLELQSYPYWDATTKSLNASGMFAGLRSAGALDLVLLHACCHNPTGLDPSADEWRTILETIRERNALPLIDAAYIGFRDGIEEDCSVIRDVVQSGYPAVIALSCSKNFSLYSQRLGLLLFVLPESSQRARARSQFVRIIRSMYSNPPSYGAQLVTAVLENSERRDAWFKEVAEMRERLQRMRTQLTSVLQSACGNSFDHIARQAGLFSYSGLTKDEVARLKEEFGIYILDSGRMCVAALNESNLPLLVEGIRAVRAG